MTAEKTIESINQEIKDLQETLKKDIPFSDQEDILRAIIKLLDERKGLVNG
jgi:hypothetical protein